MPIKRVQFPDGSIHRVEVPEGATNEQILAFVQSQYQPPKDSPGGQKPAPQGGMTREQRQAQIAALDAQNKPAPSPIDGMGPFDQFMAGVGKSFVDTGLGLKQAGTSMAEYFVRANPALFDQRSLGSLVTGEDDSTAGKLRASLERQHAEQAEREQLDAPLLDAGWGAGGDAVGIVTQLVGPGGLAKLAARAPKLASAAPILEATGRALLPGTVKGSTAQGAVFGATRPVSDEGQRATNTGTNAALSGVGAGIPRLIGATSRALRGSPLSAAGAERRAVETVMQQAENPQSLLTPQPSTIPGVQRTLAESTLDGGVARLERLARDRGRGWTALDSRNNYARAEAIGAFAGDDVAMDAAKAARSEQTGGLLDQALQATGVDKGPLSQALDDIIAKNAGRSAVQDTMRVVQGELSNVGDDVAGLYNVRKSIDDLMQGRAGADKAAAKAAKRELVQVKGLLDDQIKAVSPEFGQYLDAYVAGSKPINRMQLGQSLLDTGTGKTRDAVTGAYQILPGAFGSQVKNLDRLAQRSTGFKGATARGLLEPEDFATIAGVEDDLSRQVFARTANVGKNSHTHQLGDTAQKVTRQSLSRGIPLYGAVVEHLEKVGAQRVADALDVVLQDPARFQQVAAGLSAGERRLLEQALVRIGGPAGMALPSVK